MRTAKQTILIAVVLALPYLVTGILSDGPDAGRLVQGGIVVLVLAGVAAAFTAAAWTRLRTSARTSSSRGRPDSRSA